MVFFTRYFYVAAGITIAILAGLIPLKLEAKSPASTSAQLPSLSQMQEAGFFLWSGQWDLALAALKNVNLEEKKSLKDLATNRQRFVAGYLKYKNGQFAEAVPLFEAVARDSLALKDYARYYQSLSLREAGEAKAAIQILERLSQENVPPVLRKKLKKDLALAYCKAGDRGTGVESLNELIQTEHSEIVAYHLRYDRIRCLMMIEAKEEAAASLKTLFLHYPEGDLREQILSALKALGKVEMLSPGDYEQRGDQLVANDRPQLAALDYEAALAAWGESGSLVLRKKLAEAYFKSRQYPLAAQAYEELQRRSPGGLDSETETRLAQAYSRSDQFDKAIHVYDTMLSSHESGERPDLEYKIAFLTMDKGELDSANRQFAHLLDAYPQHPQREQMRWLMAWNHYQLQQWDQALYQFALLQQSFPSGRYAQRVPYWRARILEKQGKSDLAHQAYQNIVSGDPLGYYGFLSLKRLEKNWEAQQAPHSHFAAQLPKGSIPAPLSPEKLEPGKNQNLLRAKELLMVGLWEDFLGELEQLTSQETLHGDFARLQRELLNPAQMNGSKGGGVLGSHPPAYSTLVALFSQIRNFPPALTWAIMREESRFRPDVVSPAQAMGLMQIIPPTGQEIANDLGRQGFVPEQLYQPVTNIEFGVHYLNKNRQRFDGALPQTIASYNAGPEAVERWLKSRPNRDWDEFIEEIPYKETNNYVKKVLVSYYIYSLVY